METYNIGSTICINNNSSDVSWNRPRHLLRLRCGDVGKIKEGNIPSPLPKPMVTWHHTSLDGSSAFLAKNKDPDEIDDVSYEPPDEFIEAFPGLF